MLRMDAEVDAMLELDLGDAILELDLGDAMLELDLGDAVLELEGLVEAVDVESDHTNVGIAFEIPPGCCC